MPLLAHLMVDHLVFNVAKNKKENLSCMQSLLMLADPGGWDEDKETWYFLLGSIKNFIFSRGEGVYYP